MSAAPRRSIGRASSVVVLGILLHATYLNSIFDIYFVSPVIHVDRKYSALDLLDERPPADRLVLIIGDGLRADKLFQLYEDPPFSPMYELPTGLDYGEPQGLPGNKTTAAPYLRSLITGGRAAWGVSHTRVPTESRPGHVALLAGMYEDVSAVTRGWKINPVGFDSILNQSTHSWGFGSPDIVPMFVEGATDGRAEMWCYSGADEDFTADAIHLDTWVLNRVEEMFTNATQSDQLDHRMRQHGNVYFLHLLGLDTTGHSYRPHSPEYHRNIAVVDAIVKRVETLFSDFFRDERTTFVFTADHGMTNIGNHGDGNPDATRTPLVAWGSGVRPSSNSFGHHDEYSKLWQLDEQERMDVEQADVAALITALLGRPVPGNSDGRLPHRYLEATPRYSTNAAFANARGILEQFHVKQADLAARKISFRPFPELSSASAGRIDRSSETQIANILSLIDDGAWEQALVRCQDLEEAALRGLRYLRTYDWLLLRIIVVSGYLGWMAYTAGFVLREYVEPSDAIVTGTGSTAGGAALGTLAVMVTKFVAEGSPATYHLYIAFACFFWWRVALDFAPLQRLLRRTLASLSDLVTALATFLLLELAVLGYSQRSAWTIAFLILGIIWPYMASPPSFRAVKANQRVAVAWAMSCLATSVFTLLPVEKGESLLLISTGAAVIIVVGAVATARLRLPISPLPPWRQPNSAQLKAIHAEQRERKMLARVLLAEICLAGVSLAVTVTSTLNLQAKRGLPLASQLMGWVVLLISSAMPFVGLRCVGRPIPRLMVLIGGFAPTIILLSISYEVLFYLSFSLTLLLWLVFERHLVEHSRALPPLKAVKPTKQSDTVKDMAKLDARHIRVALCFVQFIHVGFFGTGNVASISSFYLEPVYRLVPIFDPFLMAALLIYKILIPFAVVSAVFSAVHSAVGARPFSIFLIALTLTDVLTLNFFFLVRDQGSWLEIGQGISHFVIASLLIVFVLLLHLGGEQLMHSTAISTT